MEHYQNFMNQVKRYAIAAVACAALAGCSIDKKVGNNDENDDRNLANKARRLMPLETANDQKKQELVYVIQEFRKAHNLAAMLSYIEANEKPYSHKRGLHGGDDIGNGIGQPNPNPGTGICGGDNYTPGLGAPGGE